MNQLEFVFEFNRTNLHMPTIRFSDILEIFILAFLIYQILVWARNTRLWSLLKGVIVILVFILVCAILNMSTILWIVERVFSIAIIAMVVILQPELRKALEELGRKNFITNMFSIGDNKYTGRFTDKTLNEITRACVEMAKVRTGALIVIEQSHPLTEFEMTGIEVDAIVTSQLLINIFEHNTPLHDGAVVVRGDRITAATCYLPLSDNLSLSKELGTRHRAGVGISEVTDSLTIIVSEETGRISIAYEGELIRNVDAETFRQKLEMIQNKPETEKKRSFFKGKGGKQA